MRWPRRLRFPHGIPRTVVLHREWSIGDDEQGRIVWLDGETPADPGPGERVQYRYVTEWIPDE